MAVIVILACLVASPTDCSKVEIQVEACTAHGLAAMAQWAMAHPHYRIEKWWGCARGVPA